MGDGPGVSAGAVSILLSQGLPRLGGDSVFHLSNIARIDESGTGEDRIATADHVAVLDVQHQRDHR